MSEWHKKRLRAAQDRFNEVDGQYRTGMGRRRELSKARIMAAAKVLQAQMQAKKAQRVGK